MMHFNTFTRKNTANSSFSSFLLCNLHQDQRLDIVCIDENCKEKARLLCVQCRYHSHRKHKIEPLEVFIQKYEQLILKYDKLPENLDLSYLDFLYKKTCEKLEKILEDFKENFSKVLHKINEDYQHKIKTLEKTLKDENEALILNNLKQGKDPKFAIETLNDLFSKILINKDEDFRSRNIKRGADEFRGLENAISHLERFIEKDLEKSLNDFKKNLNLASSKFSNFGLENTEEEKFREKGWDDEKFRKITDIKQCENEILFRNYRFSQYLEILKHDFSNMMDKLEESQGFGVDYMKNEKFVKNKREFIAEFETSLLKFPQKDLISWNL